MITNEIYNIKLHNKVFIQSTKDINEYGGRKVHKKLFQFDA